MGITAHRPDYNDPQKYFRETDNFVGSGNASGSLGRLGWAKAGSGAPPNATQVANEAGSHGTKGLATDAGNNTRWSSFNPNQPAPVTGTRLQIRIRPDDSGANTAYWHAGICDGTGVDTRTGAAGHLLGFRVDTSVDSNVYGVVKNGAGSESTVSLGAIDTSNWHTYGLIHTGAGVLFTKDGSPVGTAPLTNLSSDTTQASYIRVEDLGAATRTLWITFWDLIIPTGY